ncbi:MAG: hypothetical protein H7222_15105 [Methylotenera sp.]|nr:hypothetical protein [Oligoflexia bacterium]
MKPIRLTSALAAFAIASQTAIASTAIVLEPAPSRPTALPAVLPGEIQIQLHGHAFSLFTNADLNQAHPNVEQALLIIHGSEGNADRYFKTGMAVASQIGKSDTTVVIAPRFKVQTDRPGPTEFSFTDEGWIRGDAALNDSKFGSFDIVDSLLILLSDRLNFPHLKSIVVTGHSAGGQLTQRFAIGSSVEDSLKEIRIRYLVVNPGSFAYLNGDRRVSSTLFAIPAGTGNCRYNAYKYGLENLNAYESRTPVAEAIPRYLARDIVYLTGEQDVLTDGLDNSCEAELQGHTRHERSLNFRAFLDQDYPAHRHSLLTVPGIGHSEWGMYTSTQAKQLLF